MRKRCHILLMEMIFPSLLKKGLVQQSDGDIECLVGIHATMASLREAEKAWRDCTTNEYIR